jgi:hypothetical protein
VRAGARLVVLREVLRRAVCARAVAFRGGMPKTVLA